MTIEIKKSVKPIKYKSAIDILEDRLEQIKVNKNKELIWILEHEEIYTCLLYTSPSPRDLSTSRMPSSA